MLALQCFAPSKGCRRRGGRFLDHWGAVGGEAWERRAYFGRRAVSHASTPALQ